MIRLLIAEDSTTVQRVLVSLLEGENNIRIVGIASDGEQAVQMCKELRPDLVTMDIFMPKMNGLEATKIIMAECPTRIVIISSMVKAKDTTFAFEAMRAGAVEVIEKPTGILSGKYQEIKQSLISLIKNTVLSRPDAQLSWLPSIPPSIAWTQETETEPTTFEPAIELTGIPQIVCIGGSTGAPTVIVEILSALPATYPVPIIVAQHISKGFAKKMCTWLNSAMALTVKMATEKTIPTPGEVLICPDDLHLSFVRKKRIQLHSPKIKGGHIPNIDLLFSSVAATYGSSAVAVILSGMGKDGANGLLQLKKKSAFTIGQTEETSVIYGMNKVAQDMGAVSIQLPPLEIAHTLIEIATHQ